MASQVKHSSVGLKLSYILFGVALIVAVVCAVLFGMTQANAMSSVAAQDDAAALEEKKSDEKKVTDPTTKVVNLVSLFGSTQDQAISLIGHGAKVESTVEVNQGDIVKVSKVVLTDESGDSYAGTPTVMLYLNKKDVVVSATYSAGTTALGYGAFSFSEAVQDVFIIENILQSAGLDMVELGSVSLPSKASYSYYDTDGKTLLTETYTFSGVCPDKSTSYDWTATLTYDYSEANSTGNLANTIKTIAITITEN